MTQQPAEDLIDQLCMLTGLSRVEAIRRLEANNNNPDAAMNEFFDDPESTKYRYDESVWTSDRDGTNNNAGISFQVQEPDEMDRSGSGGVWGGYAPSRPPSRTGNNSPYSGVISLAAEHAAADPRTKFTQEEAGDHDLQRALALSAQESGTQQMGIISEPAYGQTFGPANRPSYDANEWAMVPRGKGYAQEILPDPDAPDRKRKDDEPAFLKPSVKENRLASILTIYHEIPLAREALMNKEKIASDYGFDSEWWTGKKIEASSPNWTGDENWDSSLPEDLDNFLVEIQRLMAFLTCTERAYGSADALSSMNALTFQGAADVESKFFEAWKDACQKMDQADRIPLFYSTAVQPNAENQWSTQEKHFSILDLEMSLPGGEPDKDTIYDLADRALWEASGLDTNNSAYLDSLAEVVTFRFLPVPNSESRVRIPATWWPDRYLKANRDEALKMRQRQEEIKIEMNNINAKERKLTHFTLSSGKTVKVKDLFAASMRHNANVVDINQEDGENEQEHQYASGSGMNLSEELEKVMKSIDTKLQQLEQEKEKARATLRELSQLYTSPSTDSNTPPSHKYTLRGVSVGKFITYVCRRAEPNLISMDESSGSGSDMNGLDQWWMIEYSTSGSQNVNIKKVTEEDVLQEAYSDSSKAVVVYASEKAMEKRNPALPEALKRFVETDNEEFRNELLQDQNMAGMEESMEVMHDEWPAENEREGEREISPKRKFDGDGEEAGREVRWDEFAPPSGPPPAYSPGENEEWDKGDEKNGLGGFPSPTGYGAAEQGGGNIAGEEKEAQATDMQEMKTKGDVPRLISTMSMDVREGNEDRRDVDDLHAPSKDKP